MKKGIIFDLDGTLWDSAEGVSHAWNIVLEKNGLELTTVDIIHGLMGKQMDVIAEMLFPNYSKEEQLRFMDECGENEVEVLSREGGKLYPKLEETLAELSKGYTLAIVSNCQKGYIETFLNYHRMGKYFSDIESFGNTLRPKGENIAAVVRRNGIEKALYVGDTQGDKDAADFAELPFVHAAYGFGKVECEHKIKKISELTELVSKIM